MQILLYKNRLEIKNPGGIYGRFKIDNIGKVQPDTRNPVIATMMEDLGLTENRYSGIPTIYRAMKEAGLKNPEFADARGSFTVTLYNALPIPVEDKAKHAKGQDVLAFCKVPRSREEITNYVGLKTMYHAMQKYVWPLVQAGKLELTLPDKPKSRHQKFLAK